MTQLADPPLLTGPGTSYDADGFYYPSSEERDVPLSTEALRLIFYLYAAISQLFEGRSDVLVGADQFIYWKPRSRRNRIAPDVYVFLGPNPRPLRRSIRTWEEGCNPSFVVEVSSPDSRPGDRDSKLRTYRDT